MAKLTDTQLIVLSKAAARDDGIASIPGGLKQSCRSESWRKPRLAQADAQGAVQTRYASMARR